MINLKYRIKILKSIKIIIQTIIIFINIHFFHHSFQTIFNFFFIFFDLKLNIFLVKKSKNNSIFIFKYTSALDNNLRYVHAVNLNLFSLK
jgi:hypothetical protein